MASDFTEKSVQVGGNQVHMLTGGSGDPLVLFHGAGGNSGWLRYVQALADRYTVHIPTHPGYHQSERPNGWRPSRIWLPSTLGFWKSRDWRAPRP